MGVVLSTPVELTRVQRRGSTAFKAAVAEMQGWRTEHEDAHDMICSDKWGTFWVLDGHGGKEASLFCAPKIGKQFSEALEGGGLPEDKKISDTFEGVDAQFRATGKGGPPQSGSTIVGAVINKAEDGTYSLKICNAGDSRGLVIAPPSEEEKNAPKVDAKRPGHIKQGPPTWPLITETEDHKPDYYIEKERIEAAGGYVTNAEEGSGEACRIEGNLAVSRGLGDFEYKANKDTPASQQKVSCIPDMYEVHGLKEGTICVLACDGLWDVMTGDQVGNHVRNLLKEMPNADLGVMCCDLVHKALKMNSRDNITVMIIQMTDGSEWSKRSGRFNESDEMMHFEKMVATGEEALDPDSKKHYTSFLKLVKFSETPVQCSISARWFGSMFRCPGTGNVYMNRHYQKKGWTKYLQNGKVKDGETKARGVTEDSTEAY